MEIQITITYTYDFDSEEDLDDEIKRIRYHAPDWFGCPDVDVEHDEWEE